MNTFYDQFHYEQITRHWVFSVTIKRIVKKYIYFNNEFQILKSQKIYAIYFCLVVYKCYGSLILKDI